MEPFDIHQGVFTDDGDRNEELLGAYMEELSRRFEDSPEGQQLLESDSGLGWASTMIDLSVNHLGDTPPNMSVGSVNEVVFELIPRKVTVDANKAPEIIRELRAFWSFLQREFQLSNAAGILDVLGPEAEAELQELLSNPANFGMAKSFMTQGIQSGFDMTSQAGVTEFMRVYNARIAAMQPSAIAGWAAPQASITRYDRFDDGDDDGDDAPEKPVGSRAERRAAELERRRAAKKQAKQNRR